MGLYSLFQTEGNGGRGWGVGGGGELVIKSDPFCFTGTSLELNCNILSASQGHV